MSTLARHRRDVNGACRLSSTRYHTATRTVPVQDVSESVQSVSRPRLSSDVRVPRLRDVRHRFALSQEELAERSGVARSTIIKLEAGRDAWPSTVRKLAAALGVKPAELQ